MYYRFQFWNFALRQLRQIWECISLKHFQTTLSLLFLFKISRGYRCLSDMPLHRWELLEITSTYSPFNLYILEPDYIQALNNLGNLLKDERRYKDAEYFLRRAIRVNNQFAAAYMNLGIGRCNTGQSLLPPLPPSLFKLTVL